MIIGDADCMSNGEISISRKNVNAANYSLITGAFFWMSDEEVPIDVRRPPMPDNKTYVSRQGLTWTKIFLTGVIPGILILVFILLWVRRRGR